jgi:predicted GNAT superfamily acetyltransferase
LAHFLSAGAEIINPTQAGSHGFALPAREKLLARGKAGAGERSSVILLVEIPSDFQALKAADAGLALEWRVHARILFEDLFLQGYLVVDFVQLPGAQSRSFYLLTHGDNTL